MTLPWWQSDDFARSITSLRDISDALHDGWVLETVTAFSQTSVYLRKTSKEMLDFVPRNLGMSGYESVSSESEAVGGTLCTLHHHIVHSVSYGMPVLYFNIFDSGGRLLTLDEVWSTVPEPHRLRLATEKWSMITQQEHPLLGQPYYQLHPCHTAELMSGLLVSPELDAKTRAVLAFEPKASVDWLAELCGTCGSPETSSCVCTSLAQLLTFILATVARVGLLNSL